MGAVNMIASDEAGSTKIIHADPTKDFFVKMITRDIDLQDCIFDLLDNAIDGARRSACEDQEKPLAGHFLLGGSRWCDHLRLLRPSC